jgi:hypothetical protein
LEVDAGEAVDGDNKDGAWARGRGHEVGA